MAQGYRYPDRFVGSASNCINRNNKGDIWKSWLSRIARIVNVCLLSERGKEINKLFVMNTLGGK
jgi:hypothetical protein